VDLTSPVVHERVVRGIGFIDRTINVNSRRDQLRPKVGGGSDGDFVVVWEDDSAGPEGLFQIHARGFFAGGCEKFAEITVNADASGQQRNPDVAVMPDGRFLVAWEDDRDKNGFYQIRAAGFSAAGARLFDDITVNQDASGEQLLPSVAVAPDGRFVVAWQDDSAGTKGSYQIHAAGFTGT